MPSEERHRNDCLCAPSRATYTAMTIKYPEVLDITSPSRAFSWTERDTILYALGIGLGADPLDERELRFVYERDLQAIPTLATVVAWAAGPTVEQMGLNAMLALHGEEKTELHRPLPSGGTITACGRVVSVFDKGAGKGATITWEVVLRDQESGDRIATLTTTCFARGDGGCGGSSEAAPEPHPIPGRPADVTLDIPTRPDQALLYRLSGDRNSLHADPEIAAKAGLPRPLLHGLCTYGITCRAVLQAFADFDPSRVKSHQARFSAPVFPGETIRVDLWRDGNIVSFEASAKERGVTVIKSGKSVLI